MDAFSIISLLLSILGIYGIILYIRYLLPRNVIPFLSTLLDDTQKLLDRAR